MDSLLRGKTISSIEILQPKCLNITPEAFQAALTSANLAGTHHRGKWLVTETDRGYLLINMGMGGELLLVSRQTLPEKYRILFDFTDKTCLSVNFWWFGHTHYAPPGGLDQHEMIGKLGPNVTELTQDEFRSLSRSQRGRVKAFLLDQSRLAGIGNAYIHDILFLARLHPLRSMTSLSDSNIDALFQAIHDGLQPAIDQGGAFYEVSLTGEKGGFLSENLLVGYREGSPCPICRTAIEKIKTGGTSSFICPACQILG